MTPNALKLMMVFLLGAIVGPLCLFAYNNQFNRRILAPPSQTQADYTNVITLTRKAAGEFYRMRVDTVNSVNGVAREGVVVDAVKGEEATAVLTHMNSGREQVVKLSAPNDWDKEPTKITISLKK